MSMALLSQERSLRIPVGCESRWLYCEFGGVDVDK